MDPIDFKIVAEEILQNESLFAKNLPNSEAILRTAVGRYYYYVFLKIRETIYPLLPNKLKIFLSEENTKNNPHCLVARTLFNLSTTIKSNELKNAHDYLRTLRITRNSCDYKLKIIVNKETLDLIVKFFIPNIERAIPIIRKASPNDVASAFQKAIDDCTKRK